MAFLGGLSGLGNLMFGGLGLLAKPFGKKKTAARQTTVQRDTLAEEVAQGDALRRRKGAAADMITGTRGAEAAAGSIGRLVAGS